MLSAMQSRRARESEMEFNQLCALSPQPTISRLGEDPLGCG
jgi:hypothetical protein